MKKREKKIKTTYKKRITVLLALYCLSICLCYLPLLPIVMLVPREAASIAAGIGFSCFFALFLGISAVLLFVAVPALKRAQAREDFARYDFTPYISEDPREVFECAHPVCRYELASSLFDSDERTELTGVQALKSYLAQLGAEGYIACKPAEPLPYPDPFFIGYFGDEGDDVKSFGIKKRICGDRNIVDVSQICRAAFTQDGVTADGRTYPYDEVYARVTAQFGHATDYAVSVRLVLMFAGRCVLSFAFSGRIAAIVHRFRIPIDDRETFDYVLKNPERAFEQTALQLTLHKLK